MYASFVVHIYDHDNKLCMYTHTYITYVVMQLNKALVFTDAFDSKFTVHS